MIQSSHQIFFAVRSTVAEKKYSEKLDVGLGWQSNSPTNGLVSGILEGYPPEVSQFAPEKLPKPNRKVRIVFQPPFFRGYVKLPEGKPFKFDHVPWRQ